MEKLLTFHYTAMGPAYYADKVFEKINFVEKPLNRGEYEACRFNSCDFSNSDLSEIKFIDCVFSDCNLTLVKLIKTSFRDVQFKDCKMLGLHFENCDTFGLSFGFENCNLQHSCLYRITIKKTIFRNSQLQEVDFTECDLMNAVFDNCDLLKATFDGTTIEKADFRTAFNYSIDPEKNRIKKAKFSLPGIPGLLDKYDLEIEDTL